jgi:hypothetical protein
MLGNEKKSNIWEVGDRVAHIREISKTGTIKIVEDNQLSVMVQWDDLHEGELDFQWSNKVIDYEARIPKVD